jgi:predicted aspartyl protease
LARRWWTGHQTSGKACLEGGLVTGGLGSIVSAIEVFMGITFVKVKVTNPSRPNKTALYELLVDSGAIYSLLPVKELKKLGIKPVREEEFSLGNGEKVTKKVGNALFELQGKIGAAPVIFGDEGVYLLGVTALESMGLMLDPLRRELMPAPMLLMATGQANDRPGSTSRS